MAAESPAQRDVNVAQGPESSRVRSLRPPKEVVDPWHPLGTLVESERLPEGGEASSITIFLAGSECPFTCVFCDLWRYTLDGPTPAGALPRQIDEALAALQKVPEESLVKLYNASNFFDSRAVPTQDWEGIANRVGGFRRVTVECHPRLVGPGCVEFAGLLGGNLEIAMGLETVHPVALSRLGKRMVLDDFDRASTFLRSNDISVRAFVLVGAPWIPAQEAVQWAVRSARHAFATGAEVVSLIPVRRGNGGLEALEAEGAFEAPKMADLEDALELILESSEGVAQADVWDLEKFAVCDVCAAARISRLRRMNLSGQLEPSARCAQCTDGEGRP